MEKVNGDWPLIQSSNPLVKPARRVGPIRKESRKNIFLALSVPIKPKIFRYLADTGLMILLMNKVDFLSKTPLRFYSAD